MDDGIRIDFLNAFEYPVAQFFPGLHSNVTQKSACHLAEERLHQVQPGSVRGREDVFESVGPSS